MRYWFKKKDFLRIPVWFFSSTLVLLPIMLTIFRHLLLTKWNYIKSDVLIVVIDFLYSNLELYLSVGGILLAISEVRKEREDRLEEERSRLLNHRPDFIVDDGKLILAMKKPGLSLENIKYLSIDSHSNTIKYIGTRLSGVIVNKIESKQFVVVGRTILGEDIVFGFLNGNVEIYKYIPSGYTLSDLDFSQSDISWESYNCRVKYSKSVESLFRDYVKELIFVEDDARAKRLQRILEYDSLEVFFQNIFRELLEESIPSGYYELENIVEMSFIILDYGWYISNRFKTNKRDIRFHYIKQQDSWIADHDKIYSRLFKGDNLEIEVKDVINHTLENLRRYKKYGRADWMVIQSLLKIMAEFLENSYLTFEDADDERIRYYLARMAFETL